jgi:hypothetical protein
MKLTMSGIERAMACPASAVLPQTQTTTTHAATGTSKHAFLADVLTYGAEAALSKLSPEARAQYEATIDLSKLPRFERAEFGAEVAFALDVEADAALEIGRNIGRNYGELAPGIIPGTSDVAGVVGDAAFSADWKTGHRNVTRAADNPQVRAGALAAALAFHRREKAIGLIIYVRDGEVEVDRAEFDALDLQAIAAELRDLLRRIQAEESRVAKGETPRTSVGDHCTYCPAFRHCPAQMNLLRPFAAGDGLPVITPENAAAVLERIEAVERVLAMGREAVETLARSNPIHLPNGEIFGLHEMQRESIDPTKGAAVLAQRFNAKLAMGAVETKQVLTKESLKRQLQAWMRENPGHKAAQLEREAMDALRQGGAVKTVTTSAVRRFKPRAELTEESGK